MKSRLTITLPEDLLRAIDAQIDGLHIRNRSHAIEHLVRSSLGQHISTAFVLAGGDKNQKQNTLLQKIGSQPLLAILINQCKKHGITSLCICLPASDHSLEEQFGNGSTYGISITYSYEDRPRGTAGALLDAARMAPPHMSFLVMHGDVLADIDLSAFFEFHQREGALASIAVQPNLGEKALGEVFVRGNQVLTFAKESREAEISITDTGVYLLEPPVLDLIKKSAGTQPLQLETSIFPQLAANGQLRAFVYQGLWFDISTPKQYKRAQKHWKHE